MVFVCVYVCSCVRLWFYRVLLWFVVLAIGLWLPCDVLWWPLWFHIVRIGFPLVVLRCSICCHAMTYVVLKLPRGCDWIAYGMSANIAVRMHQAL